MGIFNVDPTFSDEAQKRAIESDKPNAFEEFAQRASLPKAISERHVACVFLLDVSGSMHRSDAIIRLNEGMMRFKEHMQSDSRTADVVDVAIVTFGDKVTVLQDFIPVSEMSVPTLTAYGQTPLGEALIKGMELVNKRKEVYKATGTPYFRPWIFCLTDGVPTDDWRDAASKLKQAEDERKVLAWCVCIENDPNFTKDEIKQVFNPKYIKLLENLDFEGLFEFVSNSLTAVSQSTPGQTSLNVSATPNLIPFDL